MVFVCLDWMYLINVIMCGIWYEYDKSVWYGCIYYFIILCWDIILLILIVFCVIINLLRDELDVVFICS